VFLSTAVMRSYDEIGEMEHYLYHQHWRVRDRDYGFNVGIRIHSNDQPPLDELDSGIVYERRYGMSWVAGWGDSWDDVPTDT
jgi:hypothetical protein